MGRVSLAWGMDVRVGHGRHGPGCRGSELRPGKPTVKPREHSRQRHANRVPETATGITTRDRRAHWATGGRQAVRHHPRMAGGPQGPASASDRRGSPGTGSTRAAHHEHEEPSRPSKGVSAGADGANFDVVDLRGFGLADFAALDPYMSQVGAKDMYYSAGKPAGCGSKVREGWIAPAPPLSSRDLRQPGHSASARCTWPSLPMVQPGTTRI
jgi:hypothetical protein